MIHRRSPCQLLKRLCKTSCAVDCAVERKCLSLAELGITLLVGKKNVKAHSVAEMGKGNISLKDLDLQSRGVE